MKLKEFKFNFNLTAWIKDVKVEAESEEEAKEILLSMPIEEIFEKGLVKDFDITDLDTETEEVMPVDAFDILEELKETEETYFLDHGELSDLGTDFESFKYYMLDHNVESYEDIDEAWDEFLDFCSELLSEHANED